MSPRHPVPLEQTPVPTPAQNEERVTCSSCRFRYPRIRGFCPICGAAASAGEPAGPLRRAAKERVVKRETDAALGYRIREALTPRLRNPIPVVIPVVVLACALYFWFGRSGKVTNESGPAAAIAPAPASPEPGPHSATAPDSKSAEAVIPATVHPITEASLLAKTSLIEKDPVELWKRVQRGSSEAEVALAKLYLEGTSVAQNCEQARLLLQAASKKGNSTASKVLSGVYSERCR